MTAEAALLLAFAITPIAPSRPLPALAERPPLEVYFGTELPRPFFPVLPPAAAWDLPDDMRDALSGGLSPAHSSGWINAPASLLLLTPSGSLVHELGLGRFNEEAGALRREMRGGASTDGRFAWHWQKLERRADTRTEKGAEARSTLVFLGSHGQILFQVDGADAPPDLPPALISADGETLLVTRRAAGAWSVTALSFTGKELASVTQAHRIDALALTPDGKRALVAWAGLDQPLMLSLLDLRSNERLDLSADRLPPGPWTLAPDGTLLAKGRPVPHLP